MSARTTGPRRPDQLHRDDVAREKATRDFLDEPHAERGDDEVIDEADELLCVTANVRGLRAAKEL